MKRLRVQSPLLNATFDVEDASGTEFVRAISDVELPMMNNWSFWLVVETLKRANETAFAMLNEVPFEIQNLPAAEESEATQDALV